MENYSCATCNEDCSESKSIACDNCNHWVHLSCECITHQEFAFLKRTPLSYICSVCLYPDSGYNYDDALARLLSAINQNLFEDATRIERLFLRNAPVEIRYSDPVAYNGLVIDGTASHLLGSNWSGPTPVVVKGDGNCLFNSLSVLLYGNEKASSELRVKTFFELLDHGAFYTRIHAKTSIADVSPTLPDAIRHCAKIGSFSCAWTMHAASSVIGRPIKSVYPVVNGPADFNIKILNTVFKPRGSRSKRELTIMWSGGSTGSFWKPCHFVPLIPDLTGCPPCINIDDIDQFPPLGKERKVTSTPDKPLIDRLNSSDDTFNISDNNLSVGPEAKDDLNKTINYSDIKDPVLLAKIETFIDHTESNPDFVLEECILSSNKTANDCSVQDASLTHGNSEMNVTNLSTDLIHPYDNPTTNSVTQFMNIDRQYEIVCNEKPIVTTIPQGVKQNVYFVLDDTNNQKRRSLQKCSEYPDDCGAWQQGKNSTKPAYFIRSSNNSLHYVEFRGGLYGKRVKKVFVPFEPQPDRSTIVVAYRKYSTLARCPTFKKRVTWFVCNPILPVAIVEYIGTYTPNIAHGNSQTSTVPYRSLTIEQKSIIRQGLENGKPVQEIRRDVNKATPDDIVDHRVVQNAKYYANKKSRSDSSNRVNVADDILSVLNMFADSNFIREVITTNPSKPPSIVLYTDMQMSLLKSAILSGTVIGIDRTFNLSSCFLTPLCFPNINLVSKRTSLPPVMLGPMLLHWDGNFDSYHKFTSHLQAKLVDTDQSNLIFGSDEEFAATKALSLSFPNASRVLCSKHLKDNAIDNLRKSLNQPEVASVISKLFGPDGILSSQNQITFDEMRDELIEDYPIPYLKDRLLPNLEKYSFRPRLQHPWLPRLWYNNCNESYNNVIKRNTNWVVQKMPDLISKLFELEQDQVRDIRGALHDTGKFLLSHQACILKVSHETWTQINPEQRQRRLLKLINFKSKCSESIVSTDGSLKIPFVSRVANKPGQRKRVKACRTTSVQNKKVKV